MAGGKKKKKAPVNPARAVMTTSIQSKAKTDTAQESSTPDASGTATPSSVPTSEPATESKANGVKSPAGRELHELSPEELEAQLEQSELQQFVEKYAVRVRKDSARHVSRLQTDKRLLRGQADFLPMKAWLSEDITSEIIDLQLSDLGQSNDIPKRPSLPVGDDLLAKVWILRLSLSALDITLERINQVSGWLLQNPPSEEPVSQTWGMPEALDWLALQHGSNNDELDEYDLERPKPVANVANGMDDSALPNSLPEQTEPATSKFKKVQKNSAQGVPQPPEIEDVDVSDVESDLEPDELLSIYLRTKETLYNLNPSAGEPSSKKSKITSTMNSNGSERKLLDKLQKIESDVLFDKREADAIWATQKGDVARKAAERKRLQLSQETKPEPSPSREATSNGNVVDEAEKLGQQLMEEAENEDNNDLLGGMFDALPGVSDNKDSQTNGDGTSSSELVVRSFGKATGMSPKRVLEEACRSRDADCRINLKQVSATTYNCRHSATVTWSKQYSDPIEPSLLPSVKVERAAKSLRVTMTTVATPDVAQSEGYVSTAALFLLASGSPKEEKAHLRLPPSFRDLWDEFAALKRERVDAVDRDTIKDLRALIDQHSAQQEDVDDEVVFSATSRFRSGAATPITRPMTPKADATEVSQGLKEMWSRTIASPSYQKMLSGRTKLPMYHAREEALRTIEKNQVTIVVGDTGSGKSTQMPQFLLEHELSQGRQCRIYCTEPRRISAISLAYRVSDELGESRKDFGTSRSLVGYAVRLDSKVGSSTKLAYATVGIVLRMLENEDGLQDITHLCLDEIHERSIDSDFLLIVLRSLLIKRPELKVVLMSATVDAQKFSKYLDGAPIISVPGRTFPVEARFLEDAIELTGHTNEDAATDSVDDNDDGDEAEDKDKSGKSNTLQGYSKKTIATLANYDEYRIDHSLIFKLLEKIAFNQDYHRFSKAILIFLPGIAEIRQLNDMLLGHPPFATGWRIHALHSTFSSDEQQAAFEVPPDGTRKIVLATNIAETGITIPDVTCVIDTGKHREMRFDERRQMSRLIQSFIARANAKQRRGRAGRVQEGLCFHLFTRHRFESMMVDQQTPEMLRLSLQDLVMRVKICKLGDIEQTLSQALDPPSSKNIRRAIDALIEVDALTTGEQLTPLGRQLAKLPLDAQLGKLLLFGASFGCLDFALTVAAAMGGKSPFLTPMHAKKQADSVRHGFKRGDSDLLTLYNAYATWRKVCTTPGLNEFSFCNKSFLSPQNLGNIEDLKAQLLTALIDAGFVKIGGEEKSALMKVKPSSRHRNFVALPSSYCRADENDLMASSVAGWAFYPKIIKQEGKGWRNIANNQSLGLHPTSVNKFTLPSQVKYLSFYSIMQSASKFTNAQETSPVSDFALVLLAGDAVFHMYAGVIVIDGNRLRFKVRDWRTMIVLKVLRAKLKEVMARLFKFPGRDLGDRYRKWMDIVERVFEPKQG